MFSSIPDHFDAPTNRLYALRDRLRAEGRAITDLVSGNVNAQGIVFPQKVLKNALLQATKKAALYKPDPLGQMQARRAISRLYASEDLHIPPNQLILTPGTSISYWYAFKVLADPGDEILCPVPCYPLFDSIAALCGISLTPYHLLEKTRWEIDFEQMEAAITPKTKAIVLISPHNPTGAVTTEAEIQALVDIAIRRKLPIILDEVFSPFVFTRMSFPRTRESIMMDPHLRGDDKKGLASAPLLIRLNGLSKMLALPGFKIGWMVVTGDPSLTKKTMKALDMISDTFLSVNEIAQFAVPLLLKNSKPFQKSYASEIRRRMEYATTLLRNQKHISFVEPEGGFFMTLRLEGGSEGEEEIAVRLLQKHGILVHPGYFYDLDGNHLVLSFASKPSVLKKTLITLLRERG